MKVRGRKVGTIESKDFLEKKNLKTQLLRFRYWKNKSAVVTGFTKDKKEQGGR